jgi:hypothetical protein
MVGAGNMTHGNARRGVGVVNVHCEWMARSFAGAHAPVRARRFGTGGRMKRVRFERRTVRPLSRAVIGVRSVRFSSAAIGLRSAFGLRGAASVVCARNNVVLLASAPHAVSELKTDSCASHARVRAAPLLPSIPLPPAAIVASNRCWFLSPALPWSWAKRWRGDYAIFGVVCKPFETKIIV